MIEFTVDPRNGDISKGAFYNFFYTGDTGETNTRDGYDYGLSVLINAKDTPESGKPVLVGSIPSQQASSRNQRITGRVR